MKKIFHDNFISPGTRFVFFSLAGMSYKTKDKHPRRSKTTFKARYHLFLPGAGDSTSFNMRSRDERSSSIISLSCDKTKKVAAVTKDKVCVKKSQT